MTKKEFKIQIALGTVKEYNIVFYGKYAGYICGYKVKDTNVKRAIRRVYKGAYPYSFRHRLHRAHKNHNCRVQVIEKDQSSRRIWLYQILDKSGNLLGKRLCHRTRALTQKFYDYYFNGIT
jgi:hypothetical protein